jgi:hypothetical protein
MQSQDTSGFSLPFGCATNTISPRDLFHRYKQAGFLYPAKHARLEPFMEGIQDTWTRAMSAGDRLLSVVTWQDPAGPGWASVTMWRTTHDGWHAQHLAATDNVVGTRAVLLAAQASRLLAGSDSGIQNWFQPNNRFSQRVFGSMLHTVGADVATLAHLQYFAVGRRHGSSDRAIRLQPISSTNRQALYDLAVSSRGPVYAHGEELLHSDILLDEVDALYQEIGLRRYRRGWLAYLPHRSQPVGAVVAYRASLGLNFSFLENRADLLIDSSATLSETSDLVTALLGAVSSQYADFAPGFIPVVADDPTAAVLAALGGELIRPYSQGIWLRAGYAAWYRHVDTFYQRVLSTTHRRGLGRAGANTPAIH